MANLKALVTGGSRGIGAAISTALAETGAQVTILGKSKESFEKFQKASQHKFDFIQLDLQDTPKVEAFVQRNLEYEVLINNAGMNVINMAADVRSEDWSNILAVNLTAPMLLTRSVLGYMTKHQFGRIINLSSIFGTISKSKRSCYSASKAGLEGFTRALALDYAKQNILANCIAPGFIDTELTREILKPSEIENLISQVPVGRLGSPKDIALLTTFLASPEPAPITNLSPDKPLSQTVDFQ
jgi:NAD(P)-dependent dehydrogenase (short-subunit alcohol dehydrogenase family)